MFLLACVAVLRQSSLGNGGRQSSTPKEDQLHMYLRRLKVNEGGFCIRQEVKDVVDE
jgi:hypothetical protein